MHATYAAILVAYCTLEGQEMPATANFHTTLDGWLKQYGHDPLQSYMTMIAAIIDTQPLDATYPMVAGIAAQHPLPDGTPAKWPATTPPDTTSKKPKAAPAKRTPTKTKPKSGRAVRRRTRR